MRALVLVAGLAVAAGAPAQNDTAPEQIMWSAESWTRSGDTYTIRGLTIEGGALRIEADRAVTTSLEFSGTWELDGSIRMRVGTARVLADSASFEFESGELVAAELAGDPATFEETEPEGAGPVRGEASRLVYDAGAGTVQMQGSASFTMAQNSMSGCDFLYELDGGLVSGSSECGVPLSIIYRPPNDEASAEGAPGAAEPARSGAEDEAGTTAGDTDAPADPAAGDAASTSGEAAAGEAASPSTERDGDAAPGSADVPAEDAASSEGRAPDGPSQAP